MFVYNKLKTNCHLRHISTRKKISHTAFFSEKYAVEKKNGPAFKKKLFEFEHRRARITSALRLVALGASKRARGSRLVLALELCMFIPARVIFLLIFCSSLFSVVILNR